MTKRTSHETRVRELLGALEEGLGTLAEDAAWRAHLEFQSRFHRYSYANTLLIARQCPGATYVAGYATWRTMAREVRRGERAIWILAPVRLARRATHRGEGPTTEEAERERALVGFRPVAVFDLSQTEGAELPPPCRRLEAPDPHSAYPRLVEAAEKVGFRVEEHHFGDGCNGDCSHERRVIRVEVENSPAQRVKTLAHELAHALLHERYDERSLAELEAESVAYVVCRHFGIDSSRYTFGYLASWAGGGDAAIAALRATLGRVQRAAELVLSACAAGDDEGPPARARRSPLGA